MSSDVQAKWMNSPAARSAGMRSWCDLIQYSTALTSWLMRASISLMRAQSAREKSAASDRSAAAVAASNGASSASPSPDSPMSHSTSTRTRARMKANSENTARRSPVTRA